MGHLPYEVGTRTLANGRLAVVVAPELGGRTLEFTDLISGRQWLWRNTQVSVGPVALGSDYDDVWQGGFEELFPNDAPTTVDGVAYPDHGELWSTPWQVVESDDSSISLAVDTPVTGVGIVKQLFLDGAQLTIRYSLSHRGETPLAHMFKLHPAMAINEHCRIDLPGGQVEKVDAGFGNILTAGAKQVWPTDADLSLCRHPSSGTNEFVYVSEIPGGWCGITDTQARSWVRLDYPTDVFPFCWIFMTYGGWRDHNVVVLEPCTNYPKDLSEAISRGTSAVLQPGETRRFETVLTVGQVGD